MTNKLLSALLILGLSGTAKVREQDLDGEL